MQFICPEINFAANWYNKKHPLLSGSEPTLRVVLQPWAITDSFPENSPLNWQMTSVSACQYIDLSCLPPHRTSAVSVLRCWELCWEVIRKMICEVNVPLKWRYVFVKVFSQSLAEWRRLTGDCCWLWSWEN